MAKRIAVLVSNDLNHDQRVLKTCATLQTHGWSPNLIGRLQNDSKPLFIPYSGNRLRLIAERGFLFYAHLQLAYFFELLLNRHEAIWSNDLDTLLPAFLVSKLHRVPLIYDSHEFFTEAAGLTGRPFQRWVWLTLERAIFPSLTSVITVNASIAEAYHARYPLARGGKPLVVRNMPRKSVDLNHGKVVLEGDWRTQLNIPVDATFLILQGAFLDKDRGVKQAVACLENEPSWYLVIVGGGEEWHWANSQVPEFNGRLICLPKMPFEELRNLTGSADVGLSLDQGVHGNYWMSLPNKLFDYIHAGIPVVASAMPEVSQIIQHYEVGEVAQTSTPQAIAAAVVQVLSKTKEHWIAQCASASDELNWEQEENQIVLALRQAKAL